MIVQRTLERGMKQSPASQNDFEASFCQTQVIQGGDTYTIPGIVFCFKTCDWSDFDGVTGATYKSPGDPTSRSPGNWFIGLLSRKSDTVTEVTIGVSFSAGKSSVDKAFAQFMEESRRDAFAISIRTSATEKTFMFDNNYNLLTTSTKTWN
jgi:hypothetical protein